MKYKKTYFEATKRYKRVEVIESYLFIKIPENINIQNVNIMYTLIDKRKERKKKEIKRDKEILSYESTKKDPHESSHLLKYEKFLLWLKQYAPYCSDRKNFPHQISEEGLDNSLTTVKLLLRLF
ncbi:MAG: hypothetical protein LBL13_02975 [Bacteroidales bacterium]|jgi:hypothetical protein|nr:hypothetical protein [Bacteroidales bacterium]